VEVPAEAQAPAGPVSPQQGLFAPTAPADAPTEAEAAAAPLSEPTPGEVPPEAEGPDLGAANSVEQLRQEGQALTPRDVERTRGRINAIDGLLKRNDQDLASVSPRAWRRQADLSKQADELRIERLEHQVRLGDPDAEAALQKWMRQNESESANIPSQSEIVLRYLSQNKLPAKEALKGSALAGDLDALELSRKYRWTDQDYIKAVKPGGRSQRSSDR
jgi:hypothetical protein